MLRQDTTQSMNSMQNTNAAGGLHGLGAMAQQQ